MIALVYLEKKKFGVWVDIDVLGIRVRYCEDGLKKRIWPNDPSVSPLKKEFGPIIPVWAIFLSFKLFYFLFFKKLFNRKIKYLIIFFLLPGVPLLTWQK